MYTQKSENGGKFLPPPYDGGAPPRKKCVIQSYSLDFFSSFYTSIKGKKRQFSNIEPKCLMGGPAPLYFQTTAPPVGTLPP